MKVKKKKIGSGWWIKMLSGDNFHIARPKRGVLPLIQGI